MTDHFVLAEDVVVDTLLRPGWRAELAAGEIERARAEVRAHLDRFCAAGLRVHTCGGRRWFDPIALNFICEHGRRTNDPFWHERTVAPRRAIAAAHTAAAPRERLHTPRRVTYELHRELAVPDRPPGSKMIATLPLPADEPTQRDLAFTPLPGGDARLTVERGLLTVRSVVGSDHRVRFGVRISATVYQQTVAVDPALIAPVDPAAPELAPYLARAEGIIRITPSVEALAQRLARRGTWETVLALWDYLFDERQLGALYHFELDPDDPLGSAGTWVDCYIGSALFIGLARACGIPARMVSGALLYPGADVGLHYWSEVFVPPYGWIPFDLHGWILAAGDRRDPRWGRWLVGHLPYQLVFYRLPRVSLELGLRYPRRWYSTATIDGAGQRYQVFDLATQALAFTDYHVATIEEPRDARVTTMSPRSRPLDRA